MKKIVFFTAAGISAESGIKTFRRDNDGLWENHKVDEVAHVDAWQWNKSVMLDFYNGLRSRLRMVEPNDAHRAIVDLEESGTFEVVVVTTNVDDLHERAGSTNVIHLHGELNKSRSTKDNSLIYECHGDINIGEKCEKGSQLRPHVIWFGENLDPNVLSSASAAGRSADYIVIVGTTMSVQPAASLPFLSHKSIPIFYVDPAEAGFTVPNGRRDTFRHVMSTATAGIPRVVARIKEMENKNKII